MKNPHHDATLKIPAKVWDELIRVAGTDRLCRLKEVYFEQRMGAGGGSSTKIPKDTALNIEIEL